MVINQELTTGSRKWYPGIGVEDQEVDLAA